MFRDREDAGRRLAGALHSYRREHPLILAIPRGGVEVGIQVALGLEAPLAILIARKLPLPDNPEAGFGAVAEDGSTFLVAYLAAVLGPAQVQEIIREQTQEIERRIQALRRGEPLPPLKGRTVIVLDDGIAMGSTMRAAVALCRHREAGKVVVAAPVASPSITTEFRELADDVVILETPVMFRAVAQAYENWYDVSDEEVVRMMDEYRQVTERTGG